jgi:hypothetical protein
MGKEMNNPAGNLIIIDGPLDISSGTIPKKLKKKQEQWYKKLLSCAKITPAMLGTPVLDLAQLPGILKTKVKCSKYRNVRTRNADGTMSDSAKEARLDAVMMSLPKTTKDVARVVRKEWFKFVINGIKVCSYEADWVVYYKTGKRDVYDSKGYKTKEYIIKKKLMKAVYGIDIIEL